MKRNYLFLSLSVCLVAFHATFAFADESESLEDQLRKAKGRLVGPAYELKYKFKKGESIEAQIKHLVTTETKIQNTEETAKMRSASTRVWKIVDVASNGEITFVHQVADVDMWQQITGKDAISYNSKRDKKIPVQYEFVARSVGKPLTSVTMTPSGVVKKRENLQKQVNTGIANLLVPLPENPIKVGERWNVPLTLPIRLREGEQIHRIKTRQVYTLESVTSGVATISVKTQLLTPVDDPGIKSKLVQRLQEGTVRFDLDQGRVISKEMDTDEVVMNFHGADSIMKYLAKYTEKLSNVRQAAKQVGPEPLPVRKL